MIRWSHHQRKGVKHMADFHELPAFEVLDRLEALTEEQREMVYVTAGEYKDHPSFPNTMARFSAALHELGYLED